MIEAATRAAGVGDITIVSAPPAAREGRKETVPRDRYGAPRANHTMRGGAASLCDREGVLAEECEELHARAHMLHREARLGLEQALDAGPAWTGFKDQIAIANRCDVMATEVEERIEEEC